MALILMDSRVDLLRKVEELVSTSFAHGYYVASIISTSPYDADEYKARQEKVVNARRLANDLLVQVKDALIDVVK